MSAYGATGAITDNTYHHNYNLGFTINEYGDQVRFAPGNLQAKTDDLGVSWTWHFAEHQWDYIGNAAANNAVKKNDKLKVYKNGTVDLFCWSETIPSVAGTYGIYSMISPPTIHLRMIRKYILNAETQRVKSFYVTFRVMLKHA